MAMNLLLEHTDDGDSADIADLPPQHAATLRQLCEEDLSLKQLIADLESRRKALGEQIKPLAASLAESVGANTFYATDDNKRPQWTLAKWPGGRSDISAELLLQAGVEGLTMEVIERCTVKRTWESWQVRPARSNTEQSNNK